MEFAATVFAVVFRRKIDRRVYRYENVIVAIVERSN